MPWNPIVAGTAADPPDPLHRIRSGRPTIGGRASAAAAMVGLPGPRPSPRWPGFGRRMHWQGTCGWFVERVMMGYGGSAATVLGFIRSLLIGPAGSSLTDG